MCVFQNKFIQLEINLDIEAIEQLFLETKVSRTVVPCSTFILELKHSIETHMGNRVMQHKFVSLRTSMNHCLKEMLTDDMIVDENSWTGGGY